MNLKTIEFEPYQTAEFDAPRGAFIAEGKHILTHGGISLEEVIVPFIRIQGRDADE